MDAPADLLRLLALGHVPVLQHGLHLLLGSLHLLHEPLLLARLRLHHLLDGPRVDRLQLLRVLLRVRLQQR